MPRLTRALSISLALHFLVVLSLAMIRAGKAKDRFPEVQMVDLVSMAPAASPHQAAPLPAVPPPAPLPSSDAPALPAGTLDLSSRPPAPPLPKAEAPPPPAPPAPAAPAAKAEVPPAQPPPAPATAEAMAPLAAEKSPPAPAAPAPPPVPSTPAAASPSPGVPGGDPKAAALALCRFAQEGSPVAADLLRDMFPRELFARIPWGQARILVRWVPDGRVVWDVDATNGRLAEALAQVHWQHFPHPSTFRLPNRAVVVDVEISGGQMSYRVRPS